MQDATVGQPAGQPSQEQPAGGRAVAGPLSGLLVVDLTRVLAGPFCTMLLADLGARVVKVERPGTGDDSRSYGPFVGGSSSYFARVNRGKESVALDLTDEADRVVLWGLLERADVVVENFRPGVMARLGLGPQDVAARNPGAVYASVSGFGQTGPLTSAPAYDAVVQARSGVMSVTGTADGPPVKPGIPISDLAGGLFTAVGVLAALLGRQSSGGGGTGRGSRVDVAMLDATMALLEGAALQYLATGAAPPRIGNAHYSIAPFDTFAVADGQLVVCAANDGLFVRLCRALERPELADDPRFADNAARHAARDALKEELERTLRTRAGEAWLPALEAAGVPCSPVADVADAVGGEQAAARVMVVEAGGVRVPGNPVKISGWPDPLQRPAAPALDADGPALRREFGPDAGRSPGR